MGSAARTRETACVYYQRFFAPPQQRVIFQSARILDGHGEKMSFVQPFDCASFQTQPSLLYEDCLHVTCQASNVIFSRNRIIGPFMYAIDLDSSSSGNLVTNNYMEDCVWEGVFTECRLMRVQSACHRRLYSLLSSLRLLHGCRSRHAQYHHREHDCRQGG